MDLFLDAEWFIPRDIFLIGWSRDRHQWGQLYDDSLTVEQFQELLDETTGIIYFYGPDIGIIEKHFDIEIRSTWHCVNLLKVFRDVLPEQKSYKLAAIEKLYGIPRNRNEYKTNIWNIFSDWRKPHVKSLVLQYNREDVLNLVKLKHIIFAQYDVNMDYLHQVRLAGVDGVDKKYIYLLPCDVYRGKYFNRGSTGVPDNDPNITAQMVISAKFMGDKVSLYRMTVLMADVAARVKYDVVTAVNGRDSAFNLAEALAKGIAEKLKLPYQKLFSYGNAVCSPSVKGKTVLIIDDVIYKGRTLDMATNACREQSPKAVYFLAFGKSSRFAY